jgi:hypothetical protein
VYTPILMEVDTPLGNVDTGDVEADSEVGCSKNSCSFEAPLKVSYPYLILFWLS